MTSMITESACCVHQGCTSSSFLTHSTVVDLLCECAALDEHSRTCPLIALGYATARKRHHQDGILCLCMSVQSIPKASPRTCQLFAQA